MGTRRSLLAAVVAGLLGTAAGWGQPALRHAATVEALTRYPLFFHGKQVVARGEVRSPAPGVATLRAGGETVRPVFLVARGGALDEGAAEVRGDYWDLGRLAADDPRLAGLDVSRLLDQVTQGRWPAHGEVPLLAVQAAAAPDTLPESVRALALEPERFEGRTVRVIGGFRGANLYGDLPQSPGRSRWDFVLRSADAAIWVIGQRPRGRGFSLDPSRRLDAGRPLEVTGLARSANGLVWIEARTVALSTAPLPAAVTVAPRVQGPPPQVAFSIPIDGDIDVDPAGPLRIQFTRDMAPDSFRGRVRVSYVDLPGTAPPAVTVAYRADNRVLEVSFAAPLERLRTVKLDLLEGIEATDGATLAPWGITFTVG